MDKGNRDREITLRVRLNRVEYDTLAQISEATGRPMGALLRDYIHSNQFSPKGRNQTCQVPQA